MLLLTAYWLSAHPTMLLLLLQVSALPVESPWLSVGRLLPAAGAAKLW
jgi:hypothetical protein